MLSLNTIEAPDVTQEMTTLEDILDIELKICEVLDIQVNQITLEPPSFDLRTLNVLKVILRKIYNRLLKSSNQKQKDFQQDDSHTFESFEEKEAYQQIQNLLQKEQKKNRMMLKKEFQYKEYLTAVIDELNQQKSTNFKLHNQFNKLNQQIQEKTLQILHLKNQTKAFQRGNKDVLFQQKPSIKNKSSYHLSSLSNFVILDVNKDQKKILAARNRSNSKSQMSQIKKDSTLKQNTLYALYNHHKNNYESEKHSSRNEKNKRNSHAQKESMKKTPFKNINSYEIPLQKSMHLRGKSEEIFRKSPNHRDSKEQKSNKKIMGKYN